MKKNRMIAAGAAALLLATSSFAVFTDRAEGSFSANSATLCVTNIAISGNLDNILPTEERHVGLSFQNDGSIPMQTRYTFEFEDEELRDKDGNIVKDPIQYVLRTKPVKKDVANAKDPNNFQGAVISVNNSTAITKEDIRETENPVDEWLKVHKARSSIIKKEGAYVENVIDNKDIISPMIEGIFNEHTGSFPKDHYVYSGELSPGESIDIDMYLELLDDELRQNSMQGRKFSVTARLEARQNIEGMSEDEGWNKVQEVIINSSGESVSTVPESVCR